MKFNPSKNLLVFRVLSQVALVFPSLLDTVRFVKIEFRALSLLICITPILNLLFITLGLNIHPHPSPVNILLVIRSTVK